MDISTLAPANNRSVVTIQKHFLEGEDSGLGGCFERASLKGVEGYQVDFGPHGLQDPCQAFGVFWPVIDACDQDVFKGDHAPRRERKPEARREELLNGIGAIDRHQLVSGLVVRSVERNGQVHRDVLSKVLYPGDQAGRGKGDAAVGKLQAVVAGDDANGLDHTVIIGKGFPHSHKHDIRQRRPRG